MKGNVLLISGTVRPYFEARTNKLRLRILNGSNARILSISFAQGCTFVAADMVEYSQLMAANEEGTLTRLQAVRVELIDPAIAAAGGRMVKTMGDGLLVEFPSPVEYDFLHIELANCAAIFTVNLCLSYDFNFLFKLLEHSQALSYDFTCRAISTLFVLIQMAWLAITASFHALLWLMQNRLMLFAMRPQL